MISNLRLRNFRSITDTSVSFSGTGLTVIVGANGSGKSNLVRALDFIARVHATSFQDATIAQGGQKSLLPKSIAEEALGESTVELDYTLELPPPDDYPASLQPPAVQHRIRFTVGDRNEISRRAEWLNFSQVIPVARALRSPSGKPPSPEGLPRSSHVRMAWRDGRGVRVTLKPPRSSQYTSDFVAWFGFSELFSQTKAEISTHQQLVGFLDAMGAATGKDGAAATPRSALLDALGLSLCPQSRMFSDVARSLKRFELHVRSLKSEQQPKKGTELDVFGDNLPAVVRRLSHSTEAAATWKRVLSTLHDVAPFVFDVRENLLATGREYVEFVESATGRPVESWDASDGTLRALAMLLAVETHPAWNTMVIEEPERGLHPWAVRFLMEHFRSAAERRHVQIILTTHSPQVLESAALGEVLVATRSEQNGTQLRALHELLPDAVVEPGELGRLWVKGLLGGHPHDV